MHAIRLTFVSLVVVAFAVAPAQSAAKRKQSSNEVTGAVIGIGVGALFPEGPFGEFNDPGYFIQSRSLYVEKVFGGRAAAYYGDTAGSNGANGGHVYGFDFDVLLKFGSARTFGYVFAGAGYGTLTYTAADSAGGAPVRHSGYDWCWTGGIGVTISRRVYIEASYVSYQTSPDATEFIPVVIGIQW